MYLLRVSAVCQFGLHHAVQRIGRQHRIPICRKDQRCGSAGCAGRSLRSGHSRHPYSRPGTGFSVFEQIGLEGSVLCINECSCLVGPHSPLYHLEQDAVPLEHLALYPRLRYERRPWPVDKDVFRIQDDYFPCSSWITINDAGSFQNFLSRTNCFFVGIHNRTAYKKIGYYNNIRTLGLSDADFSWDTIWLRRKGYPLSPLTKRYLRLLYDLVEVPYDSQIL